MIKVKFVVMNLFRINEILMLLVFGTETNRSNALQKCFCSRDIFSEKSLDIQISVI